MKSFLEKTRDARKIMVLDLGFLGDTVHLLPALKLIRSAYPGAELHVLVSTGAVSLMECTPWVDRVWGYMRHPRRATMKESLDLVMRMRRERFDALINLNGSDRAGWLTFLSGAKNRLGREAKGGGPRLWKRLWYTEMIRYPFGGQPVCDQRCRCLEAAGFPYGGVPEFDVRIPPEATEETGIPEDERKTCFHISPFASDDSKELSPQDMVRLVTALEERFPDRMTVLSCASNPREMAKMENLLLLLPPRRRRRVFAGNLKLPALAGLIGDCAVHLCGDTGTFHPAVMQGTPAVAWFWPNPSLREWIPCEGPYRIVLGTREPDSTFIRRIKIEELISHVLDLLEKHS